MKIRISSQPMAPVTRLLVLGIVLLSLVTFSSAWTKEDHEIFRVRDEVITLQGDNATFYSFLGVSPSATTLEITKVYRKKSARLHPDKAVPAMIAKRNAQKQKEAKENQKDKKPGVRVQKGPSQKERVQIEREANERYARIVAVASILQNSELRERYNHFLANGFPRWRGTGYYYQRFRPGLGSVLVGLLVVFGGGVHYGALYLSWKRQREFVERYVREARRMAWGNESGIPGIPGVDGPALAPADATAAAIPQEDADEAAAMPMNRKQKRAQEKEARKKESGKLAKTARASGISRPVEAEPVPAASATAGGGKKKVIAENGKVLFVDSSGNVFLQEETEEGDVQEFLLDPEEIPQPSFSQTALVRLPIWIYTQTVGRAIGGSSSDNKGQSASEFIEEEILVDVNPNDADAALHAATALNANGEVKKRSKGGKGGVKATTTPQLS